jgi:hypothetical protein
VNSRSLRQRGRKGTDRVQIFYHVTGSPLCISPTLPAVTCRRSAARDKFAGLRFESRGPPDDTPPSAMPTIISERATHRPRGRNVQSVRARPSPRG